MSVLSHSPLLQPWPIEKEQAGCVSQVASWSRQIHWACEAYLCGLRSERQMALVWLFLSAHLGSPKPRCPALPTWSARLACLPWAGVSKPFIIPGCLLFLPSPPGCLLWLKWNVYKSQRHTAHASIMAIFLSLPWMPAHQKVGISQEVEDSWSPSRWAVLQVWTYSEAQHPVHPST